MSTPELSELRKISKILLLANAKAVEEEIGNLANTEERKIVWVLMDGKLKVPEIIAKGKVSAATVSRFLTAGVASDLIEYEKGSAPKRILDYVPPDWLKIETITTVLGADEEKPQSKPEEIQVELDAQQ